MTAQYAESVRLADLLRAICDEIEKESWSNSIMYDQGYDDALCWVLLQLLGIKDPTGGTDE